ncbi:S9 family peptidase [Olivibacter sp. SA151]|uniref:prolyl oligopeptidase family serine peptidase n=1 Tax=Olivibacter jilunii TaxID=985016 RepID=UPI003F148A83
MVKRDYKRWILVGLYLGFAFSLNAQETTLFNSQKEKIWKKIAPYFSPPQEFKDKQDSLRPLNIFYNGDSVSTVQDFSKRQLEIKKRWDSLMGNWPALLKKQQLSIIDTNEKESYFECEVKFYWTPTEETTGYLLVPKTKGKKPAVITVFYEPETAIGKGKPNRDFALQLTKRGFITLSIGTSATSERKEFSLFYPNIKHAQVQPLSMLAYAAANAYYALANFPEVSSDKIGIMGHSFGGKWAMFASCLFDRFACAVWSDPGILFQHDRESINYWEPWYLGYHPKPWRKRGLISKENSAFGLYPWLIKNGYNLHELHALMVPRPFLVLGGAEDPPDRWHTLNRIIALNHRFGYDNRVAMHNRPTHEPNNEANEIAYLFFEYFLK